MIGIYMCKNKLNGKIYIGQSVQIEKRWAAEIRASKRENDKNTPYFIRALRKYGELNFEFSILEECSIEELDEKEIFYIKKFDSYNNGYNSTIGGQLRTQKIDYEQFVKTVKDNPNISNKELATMFNIVPITAARIRKRFDLPKHKSKKEILCSDIEAKKDEIISLYKDGLPLVTISNNLNVDYGLLIEVINDIWKLKRQNVDRTQYKNCKKIIVYDKDGNFLEVSDTHELQKRYPTCKRGSLQNSRRIDNGLILRYWKQDFPKKLKVSHIRNGKPWFEWWKKEEEK